MVELVEHDGGKYVRIDPNNVDFSSAEKAQKLADVYAIQVKEGTREVVTRLGEHVETVNTAKEGDWIVFNIGNVKPKDIPGYADMSPTEQILARAERAEAYVPPKGSFEASNTIVSPVGEGFLAKASSEPRKSVTVPFDFVIKAPWGEDQFVKAGGVIVHNGPTDVYGIDKGALENTYGAPGASQPFAETHAAQILARTPLVAEVKFSPETAQQYQEAAASIRTKS
ncbi:MAG: hypothetical protein GC136_11385 [Alphaproteobacteria bacterium]|nr:hypothetical protein [Alphaproteobacteria bacterium]